MSDCRACGDPTGDESYRRDTLARSGLRPALEEWGYCEGCADEIFRGRLYLGRAHLYPSGAGCPLEGGNHRGEDAGPWQEIAIRRLEG